MTGQQNIVIRQRKDLAADRFQENLQVPARQIRPPDRSGEHRVAGQSSAASVINQNDPAWRVAGRRTDFQRQIASHHRHTWCDVTMHLGGRSGIASDPRNRRPSLGIEQRAIGG
jgi:hypothetical protein